MSPVATDIQARALRDDARDWAERCATRVPESLFPRYGVTDRNDLVDVLTRYLVDLHR